MEEDVFSNFLTKRYNDQLQWFEAKAAAQKRRYHALQTSVVVISSSLPVLVTTVPVHMNWITATASVVLAIGTALLKMLHLPEAWINYRDTAQCLRQEQSWMEFQTGVYAEIEPPAARKKFVDRVEDILSKESGNWRSTALAPLPNASTISNTAYGAPPYRQQQPQPRGDRQGSYGQQQQQPRGDRQGGNGQPQPQHPQASVGGQDVDLGNV